jgi:hypothetical protein
MPKSQRQKILSGLKPVRRFHFDKATKRIFLQLARAAASQFLYLSDTQ